MHINLNWIHLTSTFGVFQSPATQQPARSKLLALLGSLFAIVVVVIATTVVIKNKKANSSLRTAHASSVLSQHRQGGRNDDDTSTSALTVPDGLFGTLSALAIKIITPDAVDAVSEEFLSNKLFGNGADGTVVPMSFSGHFATCSHGQLTFVPAEDRDGSGIYIRNGK